LIVGFNRLSGYIVEDVYEIYMRSCTGYPGNMVTPWYCSCASSSRQSIHSGSRYLFIDTRIRCLAVERITWSKEIEPVVHPFPKVLYCDRLVQALPSASAMAEYLLETVECAPNWPLEGSVFGLEDRRPSRIALPSLFFQ
jgi:hypothetical protein